VKVEPAAPSMVPTETSRSEPPHVGTEAMVVVDDETGGLTDVSVPVVVVTAEAGPHDAIATVMSRVPTTLDDAAT